MKGSVMRIRTAAFVGPLLLSFVAAPELRAEQLNENPLAGQPAIRHRIEYRSGRFEIGPSMAFSINRTYRQAIMFGAKMQYHFNDYLAVGADVGGGVGLDTGLTSEIEDSYAADPAGWQTLHDNLSDMTLAGDARVIFTPLSGKIALFSAAYLGYDFYLFGGLGFALLSNSTNDPGVDEANEGFRPGGAWGVGTRVYIGKYMAFGIEFKDLLFSDNESGGDLTRGLSSGEAGNGNMPVVDGEDTSFMNHFFFGFNYTFIFPTTPQISD